MAIITTADLAPWVRPSKEELDEDPLAQAVIDRASLLVNDAARQHWTLGDPQNKPPEVAVMIAEQVAARTFSNPRVVQSRSTGPMSERLADIVLTGMSLRPDEIDRLSEYRQDGGGQGAQVWVQPTLDGSTDVYPTVDYVDAYTGVNSSIRYPMGYPGDDLV